MPAHRSKKASPIQTTGWLLALLGAAIGVAASSYLIYSYIQFKLGGTVAGFCDLGVGFNCQGAFESGLSTIFGIPISVFALAFYTALLLLVLKVGPARAGRDEAWSLVVVGFVGSTAYSLFLLYVLLIDIGVPCPGCITLDVATALGLLGALLAPGAGVVKTLRTSAGDLPAALLGSPGFGFAAAFTVVLLGAGLITLEQLSEINRPVTPEEAYQIVEDETARQDLAGVDLAPVKGDPDAPLLIVEFSDFECPYCRRYSQALAQLVETYPDRIQVRFMNYPLNGYCNENIGSQGHAQACISAQAGVCAQEQERFWDMHDLMFMNSRHLERRSIVEMAESLGLDLDEFQACLDSEWSRRRVIAEANVGHAAALAAGTDRIGTPFSFVNGLLVRGARSYTEIEALALRELERLTMTEGGRVPERQPESP